jgi:hypothetical protein
VGKKKQDGKKDAPVRVLHLIDRISGYGTTRSLWDIVRLTATKDVKHFVITFSPDQGKQITAERLREMGAYRLFPKTGLLKWGRRNWVWYLVRYILVLWRVLHPCAYKSGLNGWLVCKGCVAAPGGTSRAAALFTNGERGEDMGSKVLCEVSFPNRLFLCFVPSLSG